MALLALTQSTVCMMANRDTETMQKVSVMEDL